MSYVLRFDRERVCVCDRERVCVYVCAEERKKERKKGEVGGEEMSKAN